MLLLPTFLIFLSLSVAAIPLNPRANGQTPHIRGIPASNLPVEFPPNLPVEFPPNLPAKFPPNLPANFPAIPELLKKLPFHSRTNKPDIYRRFIMGADYASSSGPFLSKSSHK